MPCCLGACQKVPYTESVIYVTVEGQFFGEYVIGCASDHCGYLGEQVLEQMVDLTSDLSIVGIDQIFKKETLETQNYNCLHKDYLSTLHFAGADLYPLIYSFWFSAIGCSSVVVHCPRQLCRWESSRKS
jgi:hypothetical protein